MVVRVIAGRLVDIQRTKAKVNVRNKTLRLVQRLRLLQLAANHYQKV